METSFDVLIIGAGVSGIGMACKLTQLQDAIDDGLLSFEPRRPQQRRAA